MKIEKILVPVDFSSCAKAALARALLFAERFDAEVRVIHIWDTPHFIRPDLMVWMEGASGDRQSIWNMVRESAAKEMEAFLSDLSDEQRARITTKVDGGDVVELLLEEAEKGEYDLIVAGTHGRTGVAHLMLGSVAERVVRRAPCPVLTVREPRSD